MFRIIALSFFLLAVSACSKTDTQPLQKAEVSQTELFNSLKILNAKVNDGKTVQIAISEITNNEDLKSKLFEISKSNPELLGENVSFEIASSPNARAAFDPQYNIYKWKYNGHLFNYYYFDKCNFSCQLITHVLFNDDPHILSFCY